MTIITKHQMDKSPLATFSVEFEATDYFGSYEATWIVSVLHNPETDNIHVSIQKGNRDGSLIGTYGKSFRNCETQHTDAERWVTEVIGLPNPIATLFSDEGWRE